MFVLYNYAEAIELYGNDYKLKKAISSREIFKIEKGIYSDAEDNFTTIELILKKYPHSFLVKDSALHLLGFIDEEPNKIHIGTARNALRIKDDRTQQHFYNNLDMPILCKNEWHTHSHYLSYENIKSYTTENNNEIRLFNLKALFFDIIRNYKNIAKNDLFDLLDKFKNCRFFHSLTEWELEDNLQYENIVSEIEFLEVDLYERLEDVFSEVRYRNIKIEYGLEDIDD